MAEQQKKEIPQTLEEAKKMHKHLADYLKNNKSEYGIPEYYLKIERNMSDMEAPNLIYPVGGPLFIHIYKKPGEQTLYNVIEPHLDEKENELYNNILANLIAIAVSHPVPNEVNQMAPVLEKLFDKLVKVGGGKASLLKKSMDSRISLTKSQYEKLKYFLIRDRVGYGKLEALFKDPNLEDIHCTGVGHLFTIHKVFGTVKISIKFQDDLELNKYMIEVSERVERPVSDAHSIVDAMMPDGSRVNFIYGKDVSLEGSSFTIRKFSKVPVSISQLIYWGTLSSEVAAYMWLCIENGINIFVCGETASGKTTTLNAVSAFIKPEDKVYTVENTPEVTLPHSTWQHLLTRESGKETDVTMQDLLIASLRSRPNYIIVGEIRGQEGNIAFQAMQTGHPVMSTFHAGNVKTMIQRINGEPINVPITFIDNLNLALIQQAVARDGKMVRRVLSLTEIERYYEPANKMVTREVFEWDAVNDEQ